MGTFRAALNLKALIVTLVASKQNWIFKNENKDREGKMHLIPPEHWAQTRHKHTPSQFEHH